MGVAVDWEASTSSGVTGYRATAYLSDGSSRTVAEVDAATTEVVLVDESTGRPTSMESTVTTTTGYGRTAESPRTSPVAC